MRNSLRNKLLLTAVGVLAFIVMACGSATTTTTTPTPTASTAYSENCLLNAKTDSVHVDCLHHDFTVFLFGQDLRYGNDPTQAALPVKDTGTLKDGRTIKTWILTGPDGSKGVMFIVFEKNGTVDSSKPSNAGFADISPDAQGSWSFTLSNGENISLDKATGSLTLNSK